MLHLWKLHLLMFCLCMFLLKLIDTIDFNMLLSLKLEIELKKKMFIVPLNSALPKFELLYCHSETNGLCLGPKPVQVWWDKDWKSKCSPWIKNAVQRNQVRWWSIWLPSTTCLWVLSVLSGVWPHLSGDVDTKCSCPAYLLDSSGPLRKIQLYVPLRNRIHLVWGEWHSPLADLGGFKLSCWNTWADTSNQTWEERDMLCK